MTSVTSWSDHAIWWHVYPLGFTGAPRTADGTADRATVTDTATATTHVTADGGSAGPPGPPGPPVPHRLDRLLGWLDYAVELGCSGIQLGPVFAAETHGYDTVDHFAIDPRLGDDADFDRLVAEAGRRGLRILLDGVFNHVGRGFPQFTRALAGDPAARRWFRWRTEPDGTHVPDDFEGHGALIALDHEAPEVADHVTGVLDHWLDRGAAGWRLDAAYAVPASFWRRVLPAVRERHPDAWFVGEMIHGDYTGYAAESGLDSITQYELWKATWSAINDGNFFELAWALGRHDQMLDVITPMTFVGNHDVTRIASLLTDERHLGHALAVLFTVGGVPSVYYGDEQAFRGVKEHRAGGDDEVRPAFPDDPAQLSALGRPTHRLHQELIGLRRRNPWLVRARTEVVHLTNHAMALRSTPRDPANDPAVVVTLLNIGDAPYGFPADQVDAGGLTVAAAGQGAGREDPHVVAAHGWSILTTPAPQ